MSQAEAANEPVSPENPKPEENTAEKKKLGVTTWIFIGLLSGIIVGLLFNLLVPSDTPLFTVIVNDIFYIVGKGFIRLMQMLVAPLVFCSIVCGAAAIGDGKMLGKVGGATIGLYLLTTIIAITIALIISQFVNPGIGLDLGSIAGQQVSTAESTSIVDTLLNIIPTNIFSSLSEGSMLQIIFFALLLGVILGHLGERVNVVNSFFQQFNVIMMRMVTLVLKVAPIGVFCLIANTFASLGLSALVPLGKFIGGTYLGLLFQLCVVYMGLLALFAHLNPIRFLKKFLPVMAFAFSTSSSNATIPLNMETLERKVGVDPKIASFTIPLGATINMDGTAIMQGVAVVFAAQAFGIDLGISGYLMVIVTATLASIGTAGVPGVGTIMLTMVFQSVGLPVEGISLIMGVDRIVDMGRTAINITGDAVVTTVVARANHMLDRRVFDADEPDAVLTDDAIEEAEVVKLHVQEASGETPAKF